MPDDFSSTNGSVYIVGGGPGDPGLITVKGLNCLHRADVVLHDRLIAPELLNEIPAHAEVIDVGKEPKRHRRSQQEINELLIEKAREGKVVVRLKGGDPFVFGRGGEECQALAEAGVRYEVVPGVSSVIAVPAYAGIPVTQRGVTTAFTVVTGHTADTSVDWKAISQTGTIVFVMGVEHLPEIFDQLIAHGRSSDTPAAVIADGTTSRQFVVVGTLADLAEKTQDIRPPALLIVGEVVRLREQIDWFIPQLSVTPALPGTDPPGRCAPGASVASVPRSNPIRDSLSVSAHEIAHLPRAQVPGSSGR